LAQFKADLNNDGRITMLDIPLLLKAAEGIFQDKIVVDGVAFRKGDLNNDGSTSLADIPLILEHLNGINLIDEVIYGA
jgi:hypothetical protein